MNDYTKGLFDAVINETHRNRLCAICELPIGDPNEQVYVKKADDAVGVLLCKTCINSLSQALPLDAFPSDFDVHQIDEDF
jgi:hypothetical protein